MDYSVACNAPYHPVFSFYYLVNYQIPLPRNSAACGGCGLVISAFFVASKPRVENGQQRTSSSV